MSDPRDRCPEVGTDETTALFRCSDVEGHGPIKLATGGFADHVHTPSGTTWNNPGPGPASGEFYTGAELIAARAAALEIAERRTPKARPESEMLVTAGRLAQWILRGDLDE